MVLWQISLDEQDEDIEVRGVENGATMELLLQLMLRLFRLRRLQERSIADFFTERASGE